MANIDVDHIIPLSAGGADSIDNLQIAHALCNISKGGQNRVRAREKREQAEARHAAEAAAKAAAKTAKAAARTAKNAALIAAKAVKLQLKNQRRSMEIVEPETRSEIGRQLAALRPTTKATCVMCGVTFNSRAKRREAGRPRMREQQPDNDPRGPRCICGHLDTSHGARRQACYVVPCGCRHYRDAASWAQREGTSC